MSEDPVSLWDEVLHSIENYAHKCAIEWKQIYKGTCDLHVL